MTYHTTATIGKTTRKFENRISTWRQFNILKYLSVFAFFMLLGASGVNGQVNYTGGTYSQNFDGLAATSGASITWTNNSTLAGWYLFNSASTAITSYGAETGSSGQTTFNSYGATSGGTDRALGGQGSGGTYWGSPSSGSIAGWSAVQITNGSGGTLNSITIGFDGEQWRRENNASAHTMVLEYGFGSTFASVSTWTAPGSTFDWTSPVTGATTAAAVNGNVAGLVSGRGGTITGLTWTTSQTLWIRWVERNDAGNDHALAIDNFTFSASAASTPPTLTAAGSATVDAAFNVTFPDDPAWRAAITGITVGGTTLTSGYAVTAGQITFTPSASSPAALLQSSGSKSIVVIATGYSNATVTQSISAGAATKLGITTQPTAPSSNGGVLAAQPVVAIQDQYNNTTTSTATVAAAVGAGTWTLGGTTSVAAVSGTASFSGLTATSAASVTGATIAFTSAGLTGVISSTFNIPSPPPANDLCSNATTLTVGATPSSGTLAIATNTSNTFTYESTKTDFWYTFTPTCTGTHTITLNFSTGPDIDFDVFTSATCPTTGTAGSTAHGTTTTETVTASFTAGTKYYIRVIDYNGNASAFTIGVATPTLTVTTNAASSINTTGATLNGNTTTLCPNITEIGFVYSLTSTNSNPINAGTGVTKVSVTSVEGNFTSTLTGLTTGVDYSYKAYAYDGTTYTYGSVQTFTPNITPVVIYQHDFGTSTPVKPYTAAPTTFNSNLNTSSWTCSGTFISAGGSSGQSLAVSSTGSGPFTLTFNVASGYQLSVSSYSYWRQTSNSASVSSITINGTAITSGALAAPTTGSGIGTTNVANTISGLTGTITVVLNITGSGSFRLDDFTLNGNVTCIPATASVLSTTTPAICNGGTSGILRVAITGGTSPFTVVYNNGAGNTTQSSYTSGSNISVTPSSATTYSLVSVTDANSCASTGLSGTPTITPVSGASNATLVSSSASPIEQCTDGIGWTYYATSAAPTQLLFAINKNGNSFTPTVDITVSSAAVDSSKSSNGANQEHASYLMKRYWNVNCGGCTPTTNGGVSVRFFYDPADSIVARNAMRTAFLALKASNPNTLADTTTTMQWIKNTNNVPYTPSMFTGNKFTVSHIKLVPTYGSLNGVRYVQFDTIKSFSGGGGGFGFGPGSGGVGLPVTWAGFDASLQKEYTELLWHTASEQNTSHFEVEASEDGKVFQKISDDIPAAGNSASLRSYTFRDYDLASVKYYRLRQVDLESSYEYSKIIVAKRSLLDPKSDFDIIAYPTSKDNTRRYQLILKNKSAEHSYIQLVDYTGRTVYEVHSMKNAEVLDLTHLTSGTYMLQVSNGEEQKVVRIAVGD